MVRKICIFIILLFLVSCAQIVRAPIKYDYRNYEKMYAAAIAQGTRMSYTIDEQNKEYGIVKMSRKAGHSTYKIKVDFGADSFTIEGGIDTDLFNPSIGKDVQAIEGAIEEAAR